MKKEISNEIVADLFKIYNSAIDAYNALILQTINSKYTIIDKSLVVVYLYIKILDNLKVKDEEADKVLRNYLLKQIIYSETGNLALDVNPDTAKYMHDVIEKLVMEKFEAKNKLLKHLKFSYYEMPHNVYTDLISFCEYLAEYAILLKLKNTGNKETAKHITKLKNKLKKILADLPNSKDLALSEEIKRIINLVLNNKFINSSYYDYIRVVLNLKDVYRYSTLTTIVKENVLFHQYLMTIVNILLAEYMNKELNEEMDIFKIMYKSLFHDFGEFKGNEIVAQIKYYNEDTARVFAEMERKDEAELKNVLGNSIFTIMVNYDKEKEGFTANLMDKIMGILKLWLEVNYMNNMTYLKSICSIYQGRLKKFNDKNRLNKFQNKEFLIDLLKMSYIFIKEHLLKANKNILLTYFTNEEIEEFEREIEDLKSNKKEFLGD